MEPGSFQKPATEMFYNGGYLATESDMSWLLTRDPSFRVQLSGPT